MCLVYFKGYVKQGRKNFILVPIAFVNEHIETLHELDIEYCEELAAEVCKNTYINQKTLALTEFLLQVGAEKIGRAAAPNDHPLFIKALSGIVAEHLKDNQPVDPKFLMRCPMCENPRCGESKNWYKQICAN